MSDRLNDVDRKGHPLTSRVAGSTESVASRTADMLAKMGDKAKGRGKMQYSTYTEEAVYDSRTNICVAFVLHNEYHFLAHLRYLDGIKFEIEEP